jgi:stage II sporulation protein E
LHYFALFLKLQAVVLWVVPGEDIYGVNPAFMLALVLILYAVYRTGAVYGCGMAAVAGSIVSVKLNDSRWLMWMLLVTLVMLIGRALTGRRKVSAWQNHSCGWCYRIGRRLCG